MGCVASSNGEEDHSLGISAGTSGKDKGATAGRNKSDDSIRVMLVGPGESGKSTILKQLRMLEAREKNKSCWSQDELLGSKALVYSNAVGQMRMLVQVAFQFEVSWSSEATAAMAKKFASDPFDSMQQSDPDVGKVMKTLWADPALRVMYNERDHLYNLNDGAGYIWDALDRIYAPDYVPTEQDILRVRLRTASADEVVFNYKGSPIVVTDVGGQKQERLKWANVLHQASTIMFVSSLCEWDQKMREEKEKLRMQDTLELFESVVMELRPDQTLVVLLNKLDLFNEKIRGKAKENFKVFFDDYKGNLVAQQCGEHIKNRFIALGKKHKARLNIHLITALETDSVRLLWHGIRETLVEEALRGLM